MSVCARKAPSAGQRSDNIPELLENTGLALNFLLPPCTYLSGSPAGLIISTVHLDTRPSVWKHLHSISKPQVSFLSCRNKQTLFAFSNPEPRWAESARLSLDTPTVLAEAPTIPSCINLSWNTRCIDAAEKSRYAQPELIVRMKELWSAVQEKR